jgi:6-phosphogluconolactonase (cycloisomerase 2 family)
MQVERKKIQLVIFAVALFTLSVLAGAAPQSNVRPAASANRLVSVMHLPGMGSACDADAVTGPNGLKAADQWALQQLELPSWAPKKQMAALPPQPQQARPAAAPPPPTTNKVLMPERTIRDLDPTYSAVGLDLANDEVILQDNNLWSTRVFRRTDNTPPGVDLTEEKRVIQGDKTQIQFNNGLYIDPKNGDIYSVESDVGDKMVVFSHGADGNVPPKRKLHTIHRVYNLAVDESRQELYATIEFPSEVDVYPKTASGEDLPIRRLIGPHTGLNSLHGIAIDEKNQLLFVNTWGYDSDFKVQGTGRYEDPAIKVFPLNASGDTPPLRVIQGDKTQLNWPAAMKLNPENGDLYVANDIGQSILVFSTAATVSGNVAPARVIKGSKTKLSYPTGIALDIVHQELWASNMGSSSATAYPLMANGDVTPIREIRSAPEGKRSLNFGRTTAVAYDSTRQQILVPN